MGERPGLRRQLESYFRATSRRCQVNSVFGVTRLANRFSVLRPSRLPWVVRRRRWPSLNRGFLPNSSLRTRISSCKYSITSCWLRFIQPATQITKKQTDSCHRMAMPPSIRQRPLPLPNPLKNAASIAKFEYLDTTGGMEKSPCKYVEQAENHKKSPKRSTLVVGQKPNRKSQITWLGGIMMVTRLKIPDGRPRLLVGCQPARRSQQYTRFP